MEDEAAVIYGLEFQCRCLTAQVAETELIKFLAGTQSLKHDNQVHLIEYDEDHNTVSKEVYAHGVGEIWHIAACPWDKSIFSTIYSKTAESKREVKSSLWQIPELDKNSSQDNHQAKELTKLIDFATLDYGDVNQVIFHPSTEDYEVITLVDNHILQWDVGSNECKMKNSFSLEVRGQKSLTCGKWGPHHNCVQICTANDTTLRGWDLRTKKSVYTIDNAHSQMIRDLDYNPNRQYYLASCGDDCKVKFWDVRNTKEEVKVLTDHSHWVWSVRFNHFHDQLVLTASSDSRVILSSTVSISSETYGALLEDKTSEDKDNETIDGDSQRAPQQDGIVKIYDEHEESVYAAEWSAADSWVFASLSYDGRLVVNRAPRSERFKIYFDGMGED